MNTNIGSMITSTAGIVGGRPRIEGTRVSVSAIAACYKQGFLAEEIVQQFERLSIAQVYAALAFYHTNQMEIDADLEAEKSLYASLSGEPLSRKKA